MSLGNITYFDKYLKMFSNPQNKGRSGEDIWADLEKWHQKKTGTFKYNTYGAFKSAKSRHYQWDKERRKLNNG